MRSFLQGYQAVSMVLAHVGTEGGLSLYFDLIRLRHMMPSRIPVEQFPAGNLRREVLGVL